MILAKITKTILSTQCLKQKKMTQDFNWCTTCTDLASRGHQKREYTLKTPDLVYVPQVMRWIRTKIGFRLLKRNWDPEFSEGAFIYGSTQAICRITQIISKNDKDDELKKLVTPNLRRRLLLEMSVHLSDIQRKIISLQPKDIKLLIPLEVKLRNIQDRKICLVALRALAVKWQKIQYANRLAIIALQTEFVRDYTDNKHSEWTLDIFDILECGIAGDPQKVK